MRHKVVLAVTASLGLAACGGAAAPGRGSALQNMWPETAAATTGPTARSDIGDPVGRAGPAPTPTSSPPKAKPPAMTTTVPAPGSGTTVPSHPAAPVARLVAYGGCDAVLSGLKAEALREARTPFGLAPYAYAAGENFNARGAPAAMATAGTARAAAPSAAGAVASTAGAEGSGYSSTNDQEVGVDEPDQVKTDGHVLAAVRQQPPGVELVDVSTGTPKVLSTLAAPAGSYGSQLLLAGNHLVVLGPAREDPVPVTPPSPAPGVSVVPVSSPSTTVTVYDISDPIHPVLTSSLRVDGSEVGARLLAGKVVLVQQGRPRLAFAQPDGATPGAQVAAMAYNQKVIGSSRLSDWLPRVSGAGQPSSALAGCASVEHPVVDSGLGTVSVTSIDPAHPVAGSPLTVVGDASVVYASTSSLYVATQQWYPARFEARSATAASAVSPTDSTDIHGFDLSDPAHPRYLGSGSVSGHLYDQYSMSEYGGDLRVATTVGSPLSGEPVGAVGQAVAGQAGAGPPVAASAVDQSLPSTGASDNEVTVLRPRGGNLVQVSQLTGMGRGERIYGVRFVGPVGYVVTFRQTDPLYVVDLADPARPAVSGSLQLTGFSAYLDPLDHGLLFGLGQEVTATSGGGIEEGVQAEVFDVSKPAAPALDSKSYLDGGYSVAEHDPHALLWWAPKRIVAFPLTGPGFDGVEVLRVGVNGALSVAGRIPGPTSATGQGTTNSAGPKAAVAMPVYYGSERSVVVATKLLVVSDAGVQASDIDSLRQTSWLPF